MKAEGKRRGRPPLEPGKAKRAAFNARLRPALKLALETAARQQGRSLSEEIEFRLERSLDQERHLADALELSFGRQVAGLMLAIGHVMKEASREYQLRRRPGELGWLSNPDHFSSIVESIDLLLEVISPDANPSVWASLREARDDESDTPRAYASIVAEAMASPEIEVSLDFGPLFPTLRSWLGEAVIMRLRDRLALSPTE
jgi:hypothetical protein